MQNIVIDRPYTFIPPRLSRFWHWVVRMILPGMLRKEYGITAVDVTGEEKLRASLEAGHGIMIVGNHCRPCDPMVLDALAAEVRRPFHILASWHLFMSSRVQRFLLPRIGVFSVYREGMDRESLKCAIQSVAEGKNPLVIFAEGIVTRSNDRLVNFMEGPAFIARAAAKQRKERKVVIHPVFTRYFFEGDLAATLAPVLKEIEQRLSWQEHADLPPRERLLKVGTALLALKEIEYCGVVQPGTPGVRLAGLVERVLMPLEDRWTAGRHDGDVMARVKRLRSAILPDMVQGGLTGQEKASRWRQLGDLYLVQQLHCYPSEYLDEPTPERLLETAERYEEDLTDTARPHPPIRAVITVGDAIEVDGTRDRSQEIDPITMAIRRQMEAMMESTKSHRGIQPEGTAQP